MYRPEWFEWRTILPVLLLTFSIIAVLVPEDGFSRQATASPPVAETASGEPERITLAEALDRFQQQSLELQVSHAQAVEQAARAAQDRAYPNPELELTHEPLFRGSDRVWEAYAVIHQPIEWPGHRSTTREVATRTAEAAEAGAQVDSLQLMHQAARAYIEAAAAEAHLTAVETALRLFQQADTTYQRRFAEGDVSGFAVEHFRVLYAGYVDQQAAAELGVADTRRTLNRLIQADPDEEMLAPVPLDGVEAEPPTLLEAQALAEQQRPTLMRIEAEVATAEAAQRAAQQARIPNPTLIAGYKRQSDGFEGLLVGAAIPIPIFNRNTSQVRAEQARLHAAETTQRLLHIEVNDEVRAAHAAYASVIDRRDRIAAVGGSPDALLASAQSSYAEGEIPLSDLLEAAASYADARARDIDLTSEQWMRYFDLLRAMGDTP